MVLSVYGDFYGLEIDDLLRYLSDLINRLTLDQWMAKIALYGMWQCKQCEAIDDVASCEWKTDNVAIYDLKACDDVPADMAVNVEVTCHGWIVIDEKTIDAGMG